MKTKQFIIIPSLLLSLISTTVLAANNNTTVSSVVQQTTVTDDEQLRFNRAEQIIKNYYVTPVTDQKLFENALRGMVSGLDPHSIFLDADDLEDLRSATRGAFAGLGIEISMQDDFIKIITPLDDGPAQKAGIKAGDIIIRIDGEPVKGMKALQAIRKMRGTKGTPVILTVLRKYNAKPLQITVIRDDIKVQSVKSRLLESGYGYLRISNFQTSTNKDAESAVEKMRENSKGKLKGLILDLRNNPGGLLESATAVADSFLTPAHMTKNSVIVYTKGRMQGSRLQVKAKPGDVLNNAPLVVLINEGSASGAEIVAGALQDYKRAVILGARSFGKGSVQTVLPLDKTTGVKITTALYYTPSGRSIQARGIEPDVIVEDLKLSSADDETNGSLSLREADLKGHLNNISKRNVMKLENETPTDKELALADYQIFTALNLLKGLVAAEESRK